MPHPLYYDIYEALNSSDNGQSKVLGNVDKTVPQKVNPYHISTKSISVWPIFMPVIDERCFCFFADLFGGEANWGLISGWETAKLKIKKLSSEGKQLEKKKRRL